MDNGRLSRRQVLKVGGAAALASAAGWLPRPGQAQAAAPAPIQPFASYWFPDSVPAGTPPPGITWKSLLHWDPAQDPDVPFNRGSVPRASRFTPPLVNPGARTNQARVTALVAFGPTSQNPSQGGLSEQAMAFSYWPYVDELVFWGGSAGEGLILAPTSTVIDAAHRHGVRVLGNVFLPPTVFGGRIAWVHDLLQQDAAGGFPVADKLIQVAELYGFDGWFVNQETAGGDAALADRMRRFLLHLQTRSRLHITWYDAMAADGSVGWQNQLDAANQEFFQDGGQRVSTTMFLNFDWDRRLLAGSRDLARRLGRSPYDLWAGIDVQSDGSATPVDWPAIVPAEPPDVCSIGFYRPDWAFASSSSVADFYQRDNGFWVGPTGDPSRAGGGAWPGVAAFVPDQSTIRDLPFASAFGTGQGTRYAVAGEVASPRSWNNLGLQHLMPSWRWIVEGDGAALTPTLDLDNAYEGGTSLRVTGSLTGTATIPLFATRLRMSRSTLLALATRGSGDVEVGAALELDGEQGRWVRLDAARPEQRWRKRTSELDRLAGRTITKIAVVVHAREQTAVDVRIGLIALGARTGDGPEPPSHVRILAAARPTPTTAELRLAWTPARGDVRHHDVFRRDPDGGRTWLGGAPGGAFFVPDLDHTGAETSTVLEVVAVDTLFRRSRPASMTFAW